MNKKILKLAIPNVLSNLSIPLLSTVDTALMGRQEGAIYIGAVALGALIFNFIYWSFAFLRMGTTGLTAQAYGKNDKTQMINVLGRALAFGFVGGCLILILQIPLEQLSFYLLGASTEVETLAQEYFYIRVWAAPATLCLYVLMGWFFGMQNVIYPLILTILINITNVFCSLYLVNILGMKADGVALGTVIAQYVGLLTGIVLFLYKYKSYTAYFQRKPILEWESFKAFMSLNSDIFIRTFCLVFSFAFFDNQSAILGDMTLAVNGVLLQFTFWLSYGVDGFGYAAESLTGKYYGANDKGNFQKAIKVSFIWGMGLAVVYSLIFGIFGESLLYIFTDQIDIIENAKIYLIWLVIFPIVVAPAYIWDGIYVGITASKAMRTTMVAALICYLLFFYAQDAFFDFGNHGLWVSLTVMMLSRSVFQWWYWRKSLNKKITNSMI